MGSDTVRVSAGTRAGTARLCIFVVRRRVVSRMLRRLRRAILGRLVRRPARMLRPLRLPRQFHWRGRLLGRPGADGRGRRGGRRTPTSTRRLSQLRPGWPHLVLARCSAESSVNRILVRPTAICRGQSPSRPAVGLPRGSVAPGARFPVDFHNRPRGLAGNITAWAAPGGAAKDGRRPTVNEPRRLPPR